MIPILFEANERDFTTNGIGRLSDAASCTVQEVLNGEFELEMKYPVSGALYKHIVHSAIIWAEPGDGRAPQAFRIYKITKPINGIVTVHAEHISYQLIHIPSSPFSASSVSEALAGLKDHAAVSCPFEFWTDKTTQAVFAVTAPSSIRSCLGGREGSILDVYGGEYEFDNYAVRLYNQRGQDSGVRLAYGKNITDLTQEENISSTITGVYPYWQNNDEYMELPEKVVLSDKSENYPFARIVPLDCSGEWMEKPTEAQLHAYTEKYISASGIGIPAVSIKVSFIALWQTEEYKDIAPLERVKLGDRVTVEFEKLGVSAKAKVIETTYNVLLDRYDNIKLGETRTNLASDIVAQQKAIESKPSKTFLQAAVDNATAWINGANGGYVLLHKDGNGQPYEIIIMDQPDIATSKKIWRWNKGGLGYSENGYAGPYTAAITQDGSIVADFITAGTLKGIEIIAELGRIAGWNINDRAIYKDVPAQDGTIYRVYFQPPISSAPDKTWILSCQKSTDGGTNFYGSFVLYADGSAKFGNTIISSDGSAKFGNGTTIYADGSAKFGTTQIEEDGTLNFVKIGKTNNGYTPYTGNFIVMLSDGHVKGLSFDNGILRAASS